ncbi:hypothetical protein NDU88_001161 [Pleurodeles waltl]|uniref:Uncharacterized protein n=1 Tax=Pleurodeles waltl TaxID=8319 RepID=A0AAV7V713_PLEWA|nr:hypothetical protein NDU88_001161 [Pleurodeles waltl]
MYGIRKRLDQELKQQEDVLTALQRQIDNGNASESASIGVRGRIAELWDRLDNYVRRNYRQRLYREGDRSERMLAWLLRREHPVPIIQMLRGPSGEMILGQLRVNSHLRVIYAAPRGVGTGSPSHICHKYARELPTEHADAHELPFNCYTELKMMAHPVHCVTEQIVNLQLFAVRNVTSVRTMPSDIAVCSRAGRSGLAETRGRERSRGDTSPSAALKRQRRPAGERGGGATGSRHSDKPTEGNKRYHEVAEHTVRKGGVAVAKGGIKQEERRREP